MTEERMITMLYAFKENCPDDKIKEIVDTAIKAIKFKKQALTKIDDLIKKESQSIEQMPKNIDFHLAVRRGLILAKQVMTDDEKKGD